MKRANLDVHNGFGEWGGYMDAKVSKLEEQFAEDALKNPYKESDLFAGISIFVNGLTNPSADELKRIMMRNGGIYHTYQRSTTKFVIATNLPDVKIRQITSAKIISPQWIVDCLKEKKILDYTKYLLYTNCKTSQPKIGFMRKEPVPTAIESTRILQHPNESDDFNCTNILENLNILNTIIREDASKQTDVKEENRKGNARTAVDPNFLTEFYNNSRLHHIATLGAGFKNYVSKLREAHKGNYPARDQLKMISVDQPASHAINFEKIIMHIDMDCFFVSVGLRSRRHLKGYPIAVTHSKGAAGNQLKSTAGVDRRKEMELYVKRHDDKFNTDHQVHGDNEQFTMPAIDNSVSLSEIASCSYEARKMGVKNGMFVGAALKLCPNLRTIPYDFDAYKEVAHTLYDTITQYTLDVEAVSCDEMYVNLSDVLKDVKLNVNDFVTHVRNEITQKTECPCSAGIGENKLQARMATKKAKPNGQFYLLPESVEEYFNDIAISDLPGVGYSTTLKLNNLNLKTCSDLQQLTLTNLQKDFGKKLGETLHQYCRGIDNKPLVYDQIRKSVSAEVNYGIRFTETIELDNFLRQLCTEVHNRLNEIGAKGKTITLKFMVRAPDAPIETAKFMGHGFCDHVTKSTSLSSSTCDLAQITQTIFSIKNSLNIPPKELRGIGIQISKLDTIISDGGKSNTLKNMFNKVIERNKSSLLTANESVLTNQIAVDKIHDNAKQKSTIFRKSKSFNAAAAPSRDMGDIFTIMANKPKIESIYEQLDLDVLAALPNDIREEVLRDQNYFLKNKQKPDNSLVENRNEDKRKPIARKIENDFHHENDRKIAIISENNILNQTDWRQILLDWLESTTEPVECDSDIIAGFFKEFMDMRRLSEVYLCLRFLHRKISEFENCLWHQVYYKIVNLVQHHMATLYGSNCSLSIQNEINCKKCINTGSIL